jgi:hypothetical protein
MFGTALSLSLFGLKRLGYKERDMGVLGRHGEFMERIELKRSNTTLCYFVI